MTSQQTFAIDPTSSTAQQGDLMVNPARNPNPTNIPPIRDLGAPPPPPQEPARTGPLFNDVDGFATAQELTEAHANPTKLNSLLAERVEKLKRDYQPELEQAEWMRKIWAVPELRDYIMAYVRGEQPQAAQPQGNQRQGQRQQQDPTEHLQRRLSQLEQQIQGRAQADMEMAKLRAQYPDVADHVPAMEAILRQNPGVSLAFAYQHAKLVSGAARAAQQGNRPPVSERPTAGIAPVGQAERLASLRDELRDRSKYRTTEDAMAEAARILGASL